MVMVGHTAHTPLGGVGVCPASARPLSPLAHRNARGEQARHGQPCGHLPTTQGLTPPTGQGQGMHTPKEASPLGPQHSAATNAQQRRADEQQAGHQAGAPSRSRRRISTHTCSRIGSQQTDEQQRQPCAVVPRHEQRRSSGAPSRSLEASRVPSEGARQARVRSSAR